MAGIGQSSVPSSDQSTPWNSSQYSMGRSTTIDNHSNIQNKYFAVPEKRRLMPEENGVLPPNMYQYSRQPTGFQSSNVMGNEKSFLPSAMGSGGYNMYQRPVTGVESNMYGSRMSQFMEPSYLSPTPHRTISGGGSIVNPLFNGQNMAKNRPGSYNADPMSLINQWDTHIGNFDSSEFPSLKPKPPSTLFSQMSSGSGGGGYNYKNMGQINYQLVTKGGVATTSLMPGVEHNTEFSIQQEDFPALPVAQNPVTCAESQQQQPRSLSASGLASVVPINSCDNSSQSHNSSNSTDFIVQKSFLLDCPDQGPSLPIPPVPPTQPPLQQLPLLPHPATSSLAASLITNNVSQHSKAHKKIYHGPNNTIFDIPNDMVADAFGLIGLVKLLAINDTYENLNILAPGLDTLSLNRELDSTKDIFPSYVSPLSSNCAGRPHDMDHPVPKEYRIRHILMDRLAEPLPEKLSDETLFWIFYNLTGEECQLTAARQLMIRQWRYNKKERFWLTRDPNGVDPITNVSYERGSYHVWDCEKAKRVSRQLTVSYKDLDYVSPVPSKLVLPFCGPKRPAVGPVAGVPGSVRSVVPPSTGKTMAAFLQPGQGYMVMPPPPAAATQPPASTSASVDAQLRAQVTTAGNLQSSSQ